MTPQLLQMVPSPGWVRSLVPDLRPNLALPDGETCGEPDEAKIRYDRLIYLDMFGLILAIKDENI